MTRLAIALAAVIGVSAMSTTEAEAKGPSGGGKSVASSRGTQHSRSHHGHHHHAHHHHHGHHHQHYRNWDYRSWSSYCWYPRYGCYCYYCPTSCGWFYYYEQDRCYLPITQVAQYPPTNVNVNVNNNNNQNVIGGGGVPALPVGAAPISGGLTPPLPGGPGR